MSALTVVIPVFNEEEFIGACLESLSNQTEPIDEVIVVDNNCTDGTIDVVRSYSDRLPVRIVSETRQGVGWARRRGFDIARNSIVARIDADTRVDPHWSAAIGKHMRDRPDVSAIAGHSGFYDVPLEEWFRRRRLSQRNAPPRQALALGGANMAIRHDAWDIAKEHLLDRPGTHEDLDLYFAVLDSSGSIDQAPAVQAEMSPRRLQMSPWANVWYRQAASTTFRGHGRLRQARMLKFQDPLLYLQLTIAWLVLKPFNPQTRRWNPSRLWTADTRHSPVTT